MSSRVNQKAKSLVLLTGLVLSMYIGIFMLISLSGSISMADLNNSQEDSVSDLYASTSDIDAPSRG